MADNQPSQAPAGSHGQNRGGRRRGRGGGAGQPGHADSQQQSTGSSGRGSRGKARGAARGGGGGGGREKQNRGADANGPRSGSGDQGVKSATPEDTKEKQEPVEGATDDADDGEICFICASNVEHTSVSPCNHRTCHICALRLRALYKNKACAHCRSEANYVVFTDDPTKNFEDFAHMDFARKDDNLGIQYEKDEIFEDTVLLLRYNCPDKSCDVACLGWPDLHRHVKSKHGKSMCDLCTRNKKVFTHEHALFTTTELRKHEKYGDDVPGAINQSGFKGHPECGFCRQRFYGDDELYTHCRDKHERCHICDRRSGHRQQQYYVDYNALEEHFQKDHFLCLDQECLEKKFTVFESQMDLKGHQLECHPNGLSKDARRDARMVDLSSFDYRTPYQPQRQRRGAGRGRDPNADPLPPSSAQPLRRDEIAYQRQMAIQSAQSVSTRSFGGQLTRNDTQPVRAPPRSGNATPARSPPAQSTPVEEIQSLNLVADEPPTSPQEQARRMRHTAVIERASNLLRKDQTKLREFRTKVSSFRTSSIGATELIDGFFSLFDTSSTELGKLVKELADIYEDEAKRTSLLQAWNDWRAINEDYPALPGPGGLLPGMSPNTVNDSGAGGSRVLRLKSSTAQSSRSAVGRSGALPSSASASASASSNNPFPPLSSPSSGTPRPSARKNASTAWGTQAAPTSSSFPSLASTTQSASARPSPRPSPAPSSSQRTANASSRGGGGGGDAFPALPTAPKPNVLMPGLTRGTVRWEDPRPSVSAWSSSAGGGGSADTADDEFPEIGNSGGGGGKKGKGKKGKQTLFHFG